MFGTGELIIIFCVILILFGGKKLPELARSIGLGIREFKKALNGNEEEIPSKKSHKETASVVIEVENESDRHK